jgi:hypothetical protein
MSEAADGLPTQVLGKREQIRVSREGLLNFTCMALSGEERELRGNVLVIQVDLDKRRGSATIQTPVSDDGLRPCEKLGSVQFSTNGSAGISLEKSRRDHQREKP